MNQEEITQLTGEKRLVDYLWHHYHQKLLKVKPIRGVLRLKTDKGTYVLKKVDPKDKARWKLIDELAAALHGRFVIPAPIKTMSGQLIFDGFQNKYVLLPWIKGSRVRLQKKREWKKISRRLALFHWSSKDFTPTHSYRKYQQSDRWYQKWKNAYRQLELFQLAAKLTKQPTEADQSWLEVASYSLTVMENLMKYFDKIDGKKCIKEISKQGKVCHGNLNRHNILIDPDQQVQLVDWNQVTLDVRTTDLAQWLQYAYRRTGSSEILAAILHGYQQISPLLDEDYALIYARFLYPDRLIKVLQQIYEDQTLPITAGAPSIYTAAKWEEQKVRLLTRYPIMVQNYFGVTIPQIDWLKR